MPTTEVFSTVLMAGSAIDDPQNHTTTVIKDIGDTVLKQDGFQQYYVGSEIGSPDNFHLFVDWDDLASHDKFKGQDYYAPFVERLQGVLAVRDQFSMYHVDFKPEGALKKILAAPVTEIATLYFGDGGPPADFAEQASKFLQRLQDGPEGFHGHAFGRSYEDIECEGAKGKVVVFVIGWDSLDAQKQFATSPSFEEDAKFLKESTKKVTIQNVRFSSSLP